MLENRKCIDCGLQYQYGDKKLACEFHQSLVDKDEIACLEFVEKQEKVQTEDDEDE
jgi:hypothetical protein